jgi:hypothetical protein
LPSVAPSRRALRLVEAGRTRLVIRVPARLTQEPAGLEPTAPGERPRQGRLPPAEEQSEAARRELYAAVQDLSRYLGRITNAEIPIEVGAAPAADTRWPILVAELARERLGALKGHSLGDQNFRVVLRHDVIGLYGESDLASSYAVYELLDRAGCRWYMPGELGEVIPREPTLELPELDEERAPSTLYRNVWYADADYKRRNRLGGVKLEAAHKLETWISEAQREQHPEWRAEVGGAPHKSRLRWSNPQLADAIADSIEARLAAQPAQSVSLSPGDGIDFDEGDDRALDAGDYDPSVNGVSLTDRLLVLANRVAGRLEARHPELLLGLLAYVSYTRPPVRERLHPNIVPVIAPITYCRTRSFTDARCPGATDLQRIVAGWRERARMLAFRGYVFNLAEPAAPNPMLRRWSEDMAFLLAHGMEFYQPETLPTFETNLPALYLGTRLSFSAQLDAASEIDALFRGFYGSAAADVRRYSEFIDGAWLSSTDFAGGNLGYAKRFSPEMLREARRLLELAKAACRTSEEAARVAMLDASLSQLERYMDLLVRLRSGDLGELAGVFERWLDDAAQLAERYEPNAAFGKVRWAREGGVYVRYAKRFLAPIVAEADRIAREHRVLTQQPVCAFRYEKVEEQDALASHAAPARLEADVCIDTWSSLGLHDYFGAVRYEQTVSVPAAAQKVHLWLSRVDGEVAVWMNGVPAKVVAREDQAEPTTEAYLGPLTFELPGPLRSDENQLVIVVRRTGLVEVGGGGLLGPVYLYAEK